MRSNLIAKNLDRTLGFVLGIFTLILDKVINYFKKSSYRGITESKKILLIKFCCLGDTLLTLPAIRALRWTLDSSEITMLCTTRTCEIYKKCEAIDKFVNFNVSGLDGSRGLIGRVFSLIKLLFVLRAYKFDLAIDFDNYYNITAFITRFISAPIRVGFKSSKQGRKYFFTHKVNYVGNRHMVEFYADLVRAIGIKVADKNIEISNEISGKEIDFIRKFLRKKGYDGIRPLISIGPGRSHNWHFIRWPEEKFIKVIQQLHKKYNATFVITGTGAEAEIAKRIVEKTGRDITIDSTALLSIDLLGALLKISDLFICNDSGPMHISAAVQTPTLAIFGPANHVRWGPYGDMHKVIRRDISCSPCLFMGEMRNCKDLKCINSIEPDEVVTAACDMLGNNHTFKKKEIS